jgi:hypothetical protein
MAGKGFEQQDRPQTISYFKVHHVARLLLTCRGSFCDHEGTLPIDGLPDLSLGELARTRTFRSSKCGGTKVELSPDWASRPSDKPVIPSVGYIVPP